MKPPKIDTILHETGESWTFFTVPPDETYGPATLNSSPDEVYLLVDCPSPSKSAWQSDDPLLCVKATYQGDSSTLNTTPVLALAPGENTSATLPIRASAIEAVQSVRVRFNPTTHRYALWYTVAGWTSLSEPNLNRDWTASLPYNDSVATTFDPTNWWVLPQNDLKNPSKLYQARWVILQTTATRYILSDNTEKPGADGIILPPLLAPKPFPYLIADTPVFATAAGSLACLCNNDDFPQEVYLFEPSEDPEFSAPTLTLLPALLCLEVTDQIGSDPSMAKFAYLLNAPEDSDRFDEESPKTEDSAYNPNADYEHAVVQGDQLAVKVYYPDDSWEWIFHGIAQTWENTIEGNQEKVTITAYGVVQNLRRDPILGALMRDSDTPDIPGTSGDQTEFYTYLPARPNQDGLRNATLEDKDAGEDPSKYPVFLDPLVRRDPPIARYWTLPMLASHVLYGIGNPDEIDVINPKDTTIHSVLVGAKPDLTDPEFDPSDIETYIEVDLLARDIDLKGGYPLDKLYEQIDYYNFGMSLDIDEGGSGEEGDSFPETHIVLFHRQWADIKTLDIAYFLGGGCCKTTASLQRDRNRTYDQWVVNGGLYLWEASYILQPGFTYSPGPINVADFSRANPAFGSSAERDVFRLWVFDEAGDGHYLTDDPEIEVTDPPSLDDLLTVDRYVHRRRPPLPYLLSQHEGGIPYQHPLTACLSISTDYEGPKPGLWDGSGTWQTIEGGYDLLDDRIGIWLNVLDPNSWIIGRSDRDFAPFPLGVVKGVESLTATSDVNPVYTLRLTCAIEADEPLQYIAEPRVTSPLSRPTTKFVDASDRYARWRVFYKSEFNNQPGGQTIDIRDDSREIEDEALQLQMDRDAEAGKQGPIVLNGFTTQYKIGDRIDMISTLEWTFQMDNLFTSYPPEYPTVVSRRLSLIAPITTTLILDDRLGGIS